MTFLTPEWLSVLQLPQHAFVGILLYIGPDVFLPLTSALAAIVGVALVFWQRVTAIAGRIIRAVFRRRR